MVAQVPCGEARFLDPFRVYEGKSETRSLVERVTVPPRGFAAAQSTIDFLKFYEAIPGRKTLTLRQGLRSG